MSDSLHQKLVFNVFFNCHTATGASPPVAGAAGSSSMGSWASKDLILALLCFKSLLVKELDLSSWKKTVGPLHGNTIWKLQLEVLLCHSSQDDM